MDKISIHTPAKGVTEAVFLGQRIFGNFNPHSREGSDQCQTPLRPACFYFNPHSREGSDWSRRLSDLWLRNFNPHSREGSDRAHIYVFPTEYLFQSTLPRREWLSSYIKTFQSVAISIHTPAKGVTSLFGSATFRIFYFNPHSREGSAPLFPVNVLPPSSISIHTPAKGVTHQLAIRFLICQFQSTLPRREWQCSWTNSHFWSRFQSTLPRREWLSVFFSFSTSVRFQSTLPRREWPALGYWH